MKDIIKSFGEELNYNCVNQISYEVAEKLSKHIMKLGEYILDEYKNSDEYVEIDDNLKIEFFGLLEIVGEYLYNIYGGYQEGNDIFKSLVLNNKNIGNENTIKQVDYYNKLGESLWLTSGEYDKAMVELNKGLEIAKKLHYEVGIATSYNILGLVYRKKGNYKKSLKYHIKSLNIRKKVFGKTDKMVLDSYNCTGKIYWEIGDYDKAGECYEKAINILKKFYPENMIYFARVYSNIGVNYFSQGKYRKSLAYHSKALEINKKELNEGHQRLALNYNNIGLVQSKLGKYEKALSLHNKSLEIVKKVGHKYLSGYNYCNIGINYYNWGKKMETAFTKSNQSVEDDIQAKYQLALENLSKSLNIFFKSIGESNIHVFKNYLYTGLVYFSKKDYKLSETFLKKSEKIFEEKKEYINLNVIKTYENLLELHKKI